MSGGQKLFTRLQESIEKRYGRSTVVYHEGVRKKEERTKYIKLKGERKNGSCTRIYKKEKSKSRTKR